MPDETAPAAEPSNDEVTKVAPPPTEPAVEPEPAPPKSYLESTFPSGLCVRENSPEQGSGFSAYFQKAAVDAEHPATIEFWYCGTGPTAEAAVQSLCEGLADCLRARDGRMAAMERELDALDQGGKATGGGMVDPSAPAADFDRQVEAAREEHVRLQARRPGQR